MTDNETRPQCRAQLSYEGLEYRCERPENHEGAHVDRDNDTWDITYVEAIPVDIRVRPVQDQLTALTVRVGLLEADRACAPVHLAEPGKEQGDYLHNRTHGDLIKELYQRVSESERKFGALREDNFRLHTRLNEADGSVREPEAVLIDPAELGKLLEDSAKLSALEAAGVDNWEGYGDARAIMRGESPY